MPARPSGDLVFLSVKLLEQQRSRVQRQYHSWCSRFASRENLLFGFERAFSLGQMVVIYSVPKKFKIIIKKKKKKTSRETSQVFVSEQRVVFSTLCAEVDQEHSNISWRNEEK